MATSDKTRDKLVASMRKSKTGPGSKAGASTRAAASKKTAARRAPAARASNKAAALAAAAMPAVTKQTSDDPYQSAGRIWPD